jgi:hypothetical protein
MFAVLLAGLASGHGWAWAPGGWLDWLEWAAVATAVRLLQVSCCRAQKPEPPKVALVLHLIRLERP